jgi:hypothetical protein
VDILWCIALAWLVWCVQRKSQDIDHNAKQWCEKNISVSKKKKRKEKKKKNKKREPARVLNTTPIPPCFTACDLSNVFTVSIKDGTLEITKST